VLGGELDQISSNANKRVDDRAAWVASRGDSLPGGQYLPSESMSRGHAPAWISASGMVKTSHPRGAEQAAAAHGVSGRGRVCLILPEQAYFTRT
jgi:hypothetical protein